MFFYVSKILGLLQPSTIILLLVAAGTAAAVSGRKRLAKPLLVAGTLLFIVAAFSPVGYALLIPLENRIARVPLPEHPAGIIMLGGFEDARVSNARGVLATNQAGERLSEAVVLARKLPDARLVFTGGVASLLPTGIDAAGPIGRYLEDAGIARERIVLERRSRTTYENALFTRELLQPRPSDRWVLVTSAHHMPRAVGVFRRAGFNVSPWPVDYRTRGGQDLLRLSDSIPGGLERVDLGFREWAALFIYVLSGRSSSVWPEPQLDGAPR